jgi:hypothetical protein
MACKLLITAAVIVGFFSIVLYRLPAAWVVPRPSPAFGCGTVEGSLWSGRCTGLIVQGRALGDLQWSLQPLSLLTLELAAHMVLASNTLAATADVQARSLHSITLRNLVADLPLDPALLPQVPATLRGHAHLDLGRLTLKDGVISAVEGRIEVRDLIDRSNGDTGLGSYLLTFPKGARGDPVGQVRDLGGPVAVDGTLQLTPRPGYKLQARIGPRPDAPPEIKQSLQAFLQYMGSPDAQDRYPYSQEGVF